MTPSSSKCRGISRPDDTTRFMRSHESLPNPTGTHAIHAQYNIYPVPADGTLGFVQIRRPPLNPPPSWGIDACRLHLRQSSIALAGSQSAIRRQPPQTLLPMEQLAARRLDMESIAEG